MEAIQSLTRTINVLVEFFQSINCLFFQLRWLEGNCRRESGAVFFVVLFLIAFCVVYLWKCGNATSCDSDTMNILVYALILSILGYFVYMRTPPHVWERLRGAINNSTLPPPLPHLTLLPISRGVEENV